MMDPWLTAARWDAEYRDERYVDEPPLPFVDTIVETIKADPVGATGVGLYVGCGNGRNYLPLVDAGLDLFGLDISPEAIRRLLERRPTLSAQRLLCDDFRTFQSPVPHLDYLIAIQVFQHGDESDVAAYFEKAAMLLRPGGLICVRVNSASTHVYHAHTVVERHPLGGFTVRYEAGPKSGLLIHFYSRPELTQRLDEAFIPVRAPREQVIPRSFPKSGSWAQWETIWRRTEGTTAARSTASG
jgi:SAM-dependent methyltransferase